MKIVLIETKTPRCTIFFNSAENVSSHRLTPLIAAVLFDPLKTPITSAYDWPIRKAFLLETVKHSL